MNKTICELFAGVGGFRVGFERLNKGWETKWFSQWEPGKKKQWAHDCYVYHFGDCVDNNGEYHTGEDISTIVKENIPDHTLLVGGFPCQDYSVAHPKSSAKGIEGKKGVLWWQIYDILKIKKPSFCLFENVDRLLKSPSNQRGRDFGIILKCLDDLGYSVEWRVVNAALYGAAQRRRRVFIFAYKNNLNYANINNNTVEYIIEKNGFMQNAFPAVINGEIKGIELDNEIINVSENFKFDFDNAGYMSKECIYTVNVSEIEEESLNIRDILDDTADERFNISDDKLNKWKYLKGSKKVNRKSKNGHEYVFSEGNVAFPDPIDKPSRTMLTSESTLNRSTHVIRDPKTNKLRILTPIEAERLQGFDDNWTKDTVIGDMPERMRYFCMGNSLVVDMVTRMGKVLDSIIELEE